MYKEKNLHAKILCCDLVHFIQECKVSPLLSGMEICTLPTYLSTRKSNREV